MKISLFGITLLFVSLVGCEMQTKEPVPPKDYTIKEVVTQGAAHLESKSGSNVQGEVTFTKNGEFIKVRAKVTGLEPGSQHGFHIHQWGNCSAKDASSAGGHYNPEETPHAGPEAEEHHVGDMGNIQANEEGVALYEHTFEEMSLMGKNPIIGRAVVVHKQADDLTSQPSGAAGPRVACGVIGVAKPSP